MEKKMTQEHVSRPSFARGDYCMVFDGDIQIGGKTVSFLVSASLSLFSVTVAGIFQVSLRFAPLGGGGGGGGGLSIKSHGPWQEEEEGEMASLEFLRRLSSLTRL